MKGVSRLLALRVESLQSGYNHSFKSRVASSTPGKTGLRKLSEPQPAVEALHIGIEGHRASETDRLARLSQQQPELNEINSGFWESVGYQLGGAGQA